MKRTSYCCCTKLYEIAVRRCTKACTKSFFESYRSGAQFADPFENKGSRNCTGVRSRLYFLPHGQSTSFTSMGSLVRVQLSPPLGSPCRSRTSTFLSPGITAEGFTFFRVHFGDVNSSGRHSVHTVVWLSCRKIGVALLVESTGFVSLSSEILHHHDSGLRTV